MTIIVYRNGQAYENIGRELEWSTVPCVGDEIRVAGAEFKIERRIFRAGGDVVELHLEGVTFEQPDLVSKDDPYHQLRSELLLTDNQ